MPSPVSWDTQCGAGMDWLRTYLVSPMIEAEGEHLETRTETLIFPKPLFS